MSAKKRATKKISIDYQSSKIYKLVNDTNDIIYVGSTASTLSRRFSSHKQLAKTATTNIYTAMRTIGVDHFTIILIELFPCRSKAELEAREYTVLDTFSKDKVYNSIFNGKPDEEVKKKLKAASAMKGKVGRDNRSFKRGSISSYSNAKQQGWSFSWQENGKQRGKNFSYPGKRTAQEAYLACLSYRESIFPLETSDYLAELPFAEEI